MGRVKPRMASPATAIATIALFVGLGGIAFAAIPGSEGEIDACYEKSDGQLRVVDPSEVCRDDEKALTWNQQGEPAPSSPQAALAESVGSAQLESFGPIGVRKPAPGQSNSKRLLRHGPFTLRGHCDRQSEPAPNDFARITVQTTEDNSAASLGSSSGKFQSSDVILIAGSGAGSRVRSRSEGGFNSAPSDLKNMFVALAPDGTSLRVISLYTGGNYAGFDGQCIFGGDVLVG